MNIEFLQLGLRDIAIDFKFIFERYNKFYGNIKNKRVNILKVNKFEIETFDAIFKIYVDIIWIVSIAIAMILFYYKLDNISELVLIFYITMAFYHIPCIIPIRQLVFQLYDKSKIEMDYNLKINIFNCDNKKNIRNTNLGNSIV